MFKVLLIGLKDLRIMSRDRAALVFTLLAPFLLTLGMGFVTGSFRGSSGGLADIPVVIVNLDRAELGDSLATVLASEELAGLLEPVAVAEADAARARVDEDLAAAAVIIPAGFTRSVIPAEGTTFGEAFTAPAPVQIELYTNPSRPTSAGVVKALVDEFISRVEEGRLTGMTSISGLVESGLLTPRNAETEGRALFENARAEENRVIVLRANLQGPGAAEFNLLAYMAPGMALLFLMYTVSYGGRSLLAERSQGTLPRLLITPTSAAQVLGGKVLGIFFTGTAQVGILILASTLLFGMEWGDPAGLAALIAAVVFGATGWGMLITALARTPAQVASTGSALMLIFGILGGSFIDLRQMPGMVQTLSRITPNAWGMDGFTTLALGGGLPGLLEPITALLVIGSALFGIAVVLFRRNGIMQT